MNARTLLAVALMAMTLLPLPAAADHCEGEVGPEEVIIGCHHATPGTSPPTNPGQPGGPGDVGDLTTYALVWLPSCPGAFPDDPDAVSVDCVRAHTCADPALVLMSLYARRLTDGTGQEVTSAWEYQGSECRDPVDLGPVQQRRQPTWTDVLSAVRRVGIPAEQVEAPDYTLVNLETTFYTTPAPIDRSLTIIGYAVDVHIEPTSYTWHWGDGTTDTSATPGAPYPSTDVTHTYVHATRDGPSRAVSVDVTYSIRYRVDGSEWLEVPETITISGEATGLPIKQAAAVLVSEDD